MGFVEVLERGMSTYCESGVGLFSTQPVNTASNLLIFVAAYFAYWHIRNQNVKNRTLFLLPFLVLLTGVGSMLWHGMPNLLTNFADILPLSAFIFISFLFLLTKLLPSRKLVWGILFGFLFVEIPFIFDFVPSLNGFVPYFLILLLGLFIAVALVRKHKLLFPQLVLVIAVFAAAFFFRTIDHGVCPIFSIGTHFIWQALNALMFYVFIRFLVAIEKQENKFVEYAR